MKYLIIGNGTAAVGTIEGIRQLDREGEITVVAAERHHTYARPLISYYLEGKTDLEKMKYRPDGFYESNGCKTLFGRRVEKIDPKEKTATLDGGEKLRYDRLMCAVGSTPFLPPVEGLDEVEEKYTFQTLDDALALERAVDRSKRVLIIGAGLIGLKCAEGLKNRAGSITVCDLAPRVLSSILDDDCAEFVRKRLEENGIQTMLSDSAERFSGHTAYMKSGAQVEFDILVLAVGVRANTALIKDAGGAVGRGILTDNRMKTTLDCVYSAGDCTESYDISSGMSRVLAILPNAYMQGECAGINMAGGDKTFENSVPMNAIGFFGLHMTTAGCCEGEMYEEKSEAGMKRLFVRDGRLVGFILIGSVERAGIYTSLIRNMTPLDEIDFELMKKRPTFLAFCKEYRGKKLGGVV